MRPAVLTPADWQPLAAAHRARAEALVASHRARRRRGQPHPVEDFLFQYYPTRPSRLRIWHPGPGIRLLDAPSYASRRGYRLRHGGAELDPTAIAERAGGIAWIGQLLVATMSRPAQFGCFGLHEWAMVYRQAPHEVRHQAWPLRLGRSGTDEVVETHRIACTHFDAFRFFTEPARPLNALRPTRELQPTLEQSGCLHATMDLYKWAAKLLPFTPGDLLLDCFELARDVRELDMRASPYDLTELGYEPIPIETAAGKAAYSAGQRAFAERARPLRGRLLDLCDQLQRTPFR